MKKTTTGKSDAIVKSPQIPISVIPAKAGIQFFQAVADHPDSGFHRGDDFLRDHQIWALKKNIPLPHGKYFVDNCEDGVADQSHTWGLSPFHFTQEWYENVAMQINAKIN